MQMEDYCITILSETNDLVVREVVFPSNYTNPVEFWQIPGDVIMVGGQTYHWRIDTGGKYLDGYETSGSESEWARFIYVSD